MAGHTPESRRAIGAEIANYAAELGVDRGTLTHLMQTNPIMGSAAFQTMMAEAVQGRLARKSLEAMRRNNQAKVPQVPGRAAAPRVPRCRARTCKR